MGWKWKMCMCLNHIKISNIVTLPSFNYNVMYMYQGHLETLSTTLGKYSFSWFDICHIYVMKYQYYTIHSRNFITYGRHIKQIKPVGYSTRELIAHHFYNVKLTPAVTTIREMHIWPRIHQHIHALGISSMRY